MLKLRILPHKRTHTSLWSSKWKWVFKCARPAANFAEVLLFIFTSHACLDDHITYKKLSALWFSPPPSSPPCLADHRTYKNCMHYGFLPLAFIANDSQFFLGNGSVHMPTCLYITIFTLWDIVVLCLNLLIKHKFIDFTFLLPSSGKWICCCIKQFACKTVCLLVCCFCFSEVSLEEWASFSVNLRLGNKDGVATHLLNSYPVKYGDLANHLEIHVLSCPVQCQEFLGSPQQALANMSVGNNQLHHIVFPEVFKMVSCFMFRIIRGLHSSMCDSVICAFYLYSTVSLLSSFWFEGVVSEICLTICMCSLMHTHTAHGWMVSCHVLNIKNLDNTSLLCISFNKHLLKINKLRCNQLSLGLKGMLKLINKNLTSVLLPGLLMMVPECCVIRYHKKYQNLVLVHANQSCSYPLSHSFLYKNPLCIDTQSLF